MIGLEISRQFFNQSEAKPKPIACCTRDLSGTLSKVQVTAWIFHCLIALLDPVVICQSNDFGSYWFFDSNLKSAPSTDSENTDETVTIQLSLTEIAVADLGEGPGPPLILAKRKIIIIKYNNEKTQKEEKPPGQAIFANQFCFNFSKKPLPPPLAQGLDPPLIRLTLFAIY